MNEELAPSRSRRSPRGLLRVVVSLVLMMKVLFPEQDLSLYTTSRVSLWSLGTLNSTLDSVPDILDALHTPTYNGQPRRIPYPLPFQLQPYFSDPLRLRELLNATNPKRPHFLTTMSGCRMARWVIPTADEEHFYFRDCDSASSEQQLWQNDNRTSLLQNGDTFYVTFEKLPYFVNHVLSNLTAKVVVISGQIQNAIPTEDETIIERLLDHPNVLAWFCQNLQRYATKFVQHTKVHPFPYGLQEVVNRRNSGLHAFRRTFSKSISLRKRRHVWAGPLGGTTKKRKSIPSAPKMEIEEYYRNVASSQYLLSPNGDRPECYRHYEAIGLGTLPITELDPYLFRHLAGAPVIYENQDWNLTRLQEELPKINDTVVNRNLILEEYWMEYVDWTVGQVLRWWNVETKQPRFVLELIAGQHQFIEDEYS